MPIAFNHTIVGARDKRESAEFVCELFDLPSPKPFGHFMVVTLEHGASLDYADVAGGDLGEVEGCAMFEGDGQKVTELLWTWQPEQFADELGGLPLIVGGNDGVVELDRHRACQSTSARSIPGRCCPDRETPGCRTARCL